MGLVRAALALREALAATRVDVPYVYDPLDYAWAPHEVYATRYGDRGPAGRALLVGMNPGPHGMGQTGVPFGDVGFVRDWMGVTGDVRAPARLHPKRPVHGFACRRREPSGTRLYGWARDRFGAAEAFFSRFFVVNYCPLLFF
ncbi:MAG TPA: single-stranded DNA-binding protein, partial [Candidatus Thermoplasmatota archaeon]|nr:single-stranded DNA-binding protein [Candidatus Thermoplasmatota archaeon]